MVSFMVAQEQVNSAGLLGDVDGVARAAKVLESTSYWRGAMIKAFFEVDSPTRAG